MTQHDLRGQSRGQPDSALFTAMVMQLTGLMTPSVMQSANASQLLIGAR